MKKFIFSLLLAMSMSSVAGPNEPQKSLEEQKGELLDFESIKDILKNDGLEASAQKKKQILFEKKTARSEKITRMFDVPPRDEMLGFISELWLVKNASILKWEFQKPDYGLEISFASFLETMGVYEQPFKILLLNSPNIAHFAIPGSNGDIIFLLSQNFIRTLDLSKLEISMLLYEDYLRHTAGYFVDRIETKELKEIYGSNFRNKNFDKSIVEKILDNYDRVIFTDGFTFKEQYTVTMAFSNVLKSNMKYWNTYFNMIKKINELVKSNLMYRKYAQIFPSPELQLGWLTPKKGL